MVISDLETTLEGVEGSNGVHSNEKKQLVKKHEHKSSQKDLIAAAIALVLALIGGAAIGPCFKYMEEAGITPFLSASWRCQCMLVFLVPSAIIEHRSGKNPPVDWFDVKPDLYFPLVVHVLIASCLWGGNLLCWIEGLKYTTAFKASLIVSSYPMMLVIMMWVLGTPASRMEVLGVLITFSGMVMSCLNSNDDGKVIETEWQEILGYILCFIAALFEVLPIFNRHTIKYVPLMQYTTVTTIFVTTLSSLFAVWFEVSPTNGSIQIFCQQDNCVFGWTSSRWVVEMLVFGFTVGVVHIAGFNYAICHVPPLIFSSSGLVDPFLTALISFGLGVDALPTLLTWLGGVIVMAGLGTITLGDHYRTEKEKAAALVSGGGDHDGGTRSRASSNMSRISAGEAGYTLINGNEDGIDAVSPTTAHSYGHGGEGLKSDVMYGSIEMGVVKDF